MKTVSVKRSRNWSERDMEMLLSGIRERKGILFSSFTNNVTNQKKKALWAEVAEIVNIDSLAKRTAEDCKAKWTHYKSETKKKIACRNRHRSQTGGGPSLKDGLSSLEELAADLIPDCLIIGCDDGIESEEQRPQTAEETDVLPCSQASQTSPLSPLSPLSQNSQGSQTSPVTAIHSACQEARTTKKRKENMEQPKQTTIQSSDSRSQIQQGESKKKRTSTGTINKPDDELSTFEISIIQIEREQSCYLRTISQSLQQLVKIQREKLEYQTKFVNSVSENPEQVLAAAFDTD